jgi:flagellar hook protein FlgE
MFKVENFEDYPILRPIIVKMNKFFDKEKVNRVPKLIDNLENLLEDLDLLIPITYILSIIAENNIELIKEKLIQKIKPFLQSENEKLKINSIIIIGFFIISNSNYIKNYYHRFVNLLVDKERDVRDNAHYFLQEFVRKDPKSISSYSNIILEALSIEEKNQENIISSLNFLNNCINLNFKQLFKFREISNSLISIYFEDNQSEIIPKLLILIKKIFPSLKDITLDNLRARDLNKLLENVFLMKKENFSEIVKREKNIRLKDYIRQFKNSRLKDKEINFYINDKKRNDFLFYELEKDKLIKFFDKNKKISFQELKNTFSKIIESDNELKLFIEMLIKLGYIKGYFSKFYFYPYNYLYTKIFDDFRKKGLINLKKNYDFLPQKFVHKIISEMNQNFLMGINNETYFSLKKIQEQIIEIAAKNSIINLKSYRERLNEEDFLRLIRNLPEKYLTYFHKGTTWLTNIGKNRVETEINNSKFVGFLDLNKISEKLRINKILLMDVIILNVDARSGIWDKNKEIFYYSKYIKERVDKINLISDENEKNNQINVISKKLEIDKKHFLTIIDENYKLIGEEIKKQDQITINEYLEKTGLEYDQFINFINDLELKYFKKGDKLIFNLNKIELAKNNIKLDIIENSKALNYISLVNFDITSNLIENLIKELKKEGKLKGIFCTINNEPIFYTIKGIRNLMLENNFLFSFDDLFDGKELDEEEIELLNEIFNELKKINKLKGTFDKGTLTFSSNDVLFAKDYNTCLFEFEKNVNKYIQKFYLEFQKIKKILTKQNETIFPQEIKTIQNTINRINSKYVFWRDGLDAFIQRANMELLKKQGLSVKKYNKLKKKAFKTEDEIKSFEDDIEVYELMKGFNNWTKLFNELELKYPNIIFYQKRLIKNPNDKVSKEKLENLLISLNLKI